MIFLRRSALVLFLFGVAACCNQGSISSELPPVEDKLPGDPRWREEGLFERVLVLGASASAGFGLNQDLGTVTSAALGLDSSKVLTIASSMFFMRPLTKGRIALEQVLEFDPTLVMALDFPFWFAYGSRREEQRMGFLIRGLDLMDRIDCPIIVGGIPDMTAAIGLMLRARQVPAIETQEQLDLKVLEWAEARPRVAFYDLRGSQTKLDQGVRELLGQPWPPGKEEILQPDRLHPTLVGLVGLCLDALVEVGLGNRIEGTPTEILAAAKELRRNR
jgi:hypothetical protein